MHPEDLTRKSTVENAEISLQAAESPLQADSQTFVTRYSLFFPFPFPLSPLSHDVSDGASRGTQGISLQSAPSSTAAVPA